MKHLDETLVDILTHAKQGKVRLDEKLTDNEITKNIVRKFLKTGKEVEIMNQSARDKWKQLEDEIRNEE